MQQFCFPRPVGVSVVDYSQISFSFQKLPPWQLTFSIDWPEFSIDLNHLEKPNWFAFFNWHFLVGWLIWSDSWIPWSLTLRSSMLADCTWNPTGQMQHKVPVRWFSCRDWRWWISWMMDWWCSLSFTIWGMESPFLWPPFKNFLSRTRGSSDTQLTEGCRRGEQNICDSCLHFQ